MEIYSEKNVKMVQMDCGFSDEEIKRFREYYATHTSDGEKALVEVNWAVIDILTKRMEQDKLSKQVHKETVKKIKTIEKAHKDARKSKLRFGK